VKVDNWLQSISASSIQHIGAYKHESYQVDILAC